MGASTAPSQATTIALMAADVARIKTLVEGNGKPGVINRLETVERQLCNHLEADEKRIEDIETKEKERRDFWNKVVLLIIGTMLSNIGLIITLIVEFTKNMK